MPVDAAAVASVQRHQILRAPVHAFDDVDLAFVWPFAVSERPTVRFVTIRIEGREREGGARLQCRPGTADPARHVGNIQQEKASLEPRLAL